MSKSFVPTPVCSPRAEVARYSLGLGLWPVVISFILIALLALLSLVALHLPLLPATLLGAVFLVGCFVGCFVGCSRKLTPRYHSRYHSLQLSESARSVYLSLVSPMGEVEPVDLVTAYLGVWVIRLRLRCDDSLQTVLIARWWVSDADWCRLRRFVVARH